MQIIKIDPRALRDNPDDARQSRSSPQADALLVATVKAVGSVSFPYRISPLIRTLSSALSIVRSKKSTVPPT